MTRIFLITMALAIILLLEWLPTAPCEVRVLLDTHTEYDIDTAEVERLLEDNGYPCPYLLDITILGPAVFLDRALTKDGKIIVGLYATDGKGYHVINAYLDGLPLGEGPGHDFSILATLPEQEQGTWIILHELGHMIWDRDWIRPSEDKELQYDHFANENYSHYSIIKEAE